MKVESLNVEDSDTEVNRKVMTRILRVISALKEIGRDIDFIGVLNSIAVRKLTSNIGREIDFISVLNSIAERKLTSNIALLLSCWPITKTEYDSRYDTVKFPVAAIDNLNVDCDAPIYHITMCDTPLERSYNVVYKITV